MFPFVNQEMLHRGEVAERESTERLSHGMAQLAFLTRLMIPAVSRAFNKEVALATRLRSARVAIAVEKYRLAHKGALPENLGDLVPEFLVKPLVDPLFAKPFEFERSPTDAYRVVGKKPTNIFRRSSNSSRKPALNDWAFSLIRVRKALARATWLGKFQTQSNGSVANSALLLQLAKNADPASAEIDSAPRFAAWPVENFTYASPIR